MSRILRRRYCDWRAELTKELYEPEVTTSEKKMILKRLDHIEERLVSC